LQDARERFALIEVTHQAQAVNDVIQQVRFTYGRAWSVVVDVSEVHV